MGIETGRKVDSSPAIGSDGTVYVGSADKKLYAIKTDSKGPSKSPWPMRGQNARHTGRVINTQETTKALKGDEAHFSKIMEDKENAKKIAFEARMKKEEEQVAALIAKYKKDNKSEVVTTKSGLRYIVLAEGKGDAPAEGARIAAHYTGTLTDGKKFDSSRDRNEPIRFPVGKGFVIPGWDEALSQMKKGERRILIIPHKLGYGERGAGGGVIPPFATLIFDVELVDF